MLFVLRVYDMIELYESIAPNDPLPRIKYDLFPLSIEQWVRLQMMTFIYVTSKGWVSTYFFPEPILFYSMVATASMLPFLTISYFLASLLTRTVHASGLMYRSAFDPVFQAKNIIFLMLAIMFALSVLLIWSLIAVTGRCLPAG